MNKKDLNFVFWGTPEIASKTLDILKDNGYLPSLIVTSPDRPQGRKMIITPPPVKIWAEKNNIPYIQPEKITSDLLSNPGGLAKNPKVWDLFIVVAYGKIIPEEIINTPKLGTINIHYSLLPKYRGASPIEQALLNGDKETGVSIQQMKYKLDSGPIIAQSITPIGIDETKEDLKNRLIEIGGNLLCEILPQIKDASIKTQTQDESQATFCKKIKKEDGEININDNPIKNYNKYRAYYGWPGTYFFTEKNGKKIRVKITKAKYENNSFTIEWVIPEGKKEINYNDFKRN